MGGTNQVPSCQEPYLREELRLAEQEIGKSSARFDSSPYNLLNRFLSFLKAEGLQLPSKRDQLDPLVMEYIEHLWLTGEGRGLAADTLASLQDHDAKIRGHLSGAWRLVKTGNT